MSLPEKRFRENTGTRYIKATGAVRCHGQASSRVRKWREEFDDYTTPTEDIWPECQCTKAATEGYYVCRWHGGLTPRTKSPPKTLTDLMPLDLAEKFKTLSSNPDYISRKDEILILKSRQWQLIEQLGDIPDSREAWGLVSEALVHIKKSEEQSAIYNLEKALTMKDDKQDVWNEIYKNDGVLKDMTATQVKTVKELRLMATSDQVAAFMENIMSAIMAGAEKYIDDNSQRAFFIQSISNELRQFANISPRTVIQQIESGS